MNPGAGYPAYSLSRGAPSATWVLLQAGERRERDSNPRCVSASLVFKTSAINRSAISPCRTSDWYSSTGVSICQYSFLGPVGLWDCRRGTRGRVTLQKRHFSRRISV